MKTAGGKDNIMKKRGLTLALAFLMLASVFCFAACGGGENGDDTVVTVAQEYPEYLKGKTYGGATFRLLVATEAHGEYFQEDDSKENVSAAIYKRNRTVMDRHGVVLEYIPQDGPNDMKTTALSLAQSGDDTYDVISPSFWWGLGNEGIVYNLLDIDTFDFSQPWWYQGWNDNLTYLNGAMYYCTGAVNLLTFHSTSVIFMNKTLFTDVAAGFDSRTVEDIYQLVLAGNWTREELLKYIALYGRDVNSDNVMDEQDEYGMITTYGSLSHQLSGWGVKLTFAETAGGYEWTFFTKKFLEKYEAYGKLLKDVHTTSTNDWTAWPNDAFKNNQVLFLTTPINNVGSLKSGDAEYTILPLTKYNESQKNYISFGYGAILTAIPASVTKTERAAVILEALNYENYMTVLPEYKETTLKYKIADDDGTRKMLDIIYDSVQTEFAKVNNEYLGICGVVLMGTNPNITSAFMKNKQMYDEKLTELLYQDS